jgi:hypothetical protein
MLIAGLGPALAFDLGLTPALGAEEPKTLSFGDLEPLVGLLQETPPAKLLPLLVEKLNSGTDLKTLTAAAAFANSRTFGGENYFGFHTFMALVPAYQMAKELPKERQPLPILKVLYRNAFYTQQVGGRKAEVLTPVQPAELPREADEALRTAINTGDRAAADRLLAGLSQRSVEDAFNAALLGVEDNHDVHTVVLPWRAWAMLEVAGREHALTLLRQSVHQTAKRCAEQKAKPEDLARRRAVVPNLLERHGLLKMADPGKRQADDGWVEKMCETVLTSGAAKAGEAVAAALAEGFAPEHVGMAISLGANQLVLRQPEVWSDKYYGRRCHGDSPGVHASDATNAWRNIVRVSNARNRSAGLILAAMDVAESYAWFGGLAKEQLLRPEHLEAVKATTPDALLKELDGAVRENDQIRACAVVQRYGQVSQDARPVFDLLLGFSVSEDGRLHAEKYYRTVTEEFATTRQAFRWRQLVSLARVSASAYSFSQSDKKEGRAPGYEEACKLLKVS